MRLLHERVAVLAIADVARDRQAAPARILDEPPRLLGVLVLLPVRAQHVGALARVGERHRAADARVGTGDQGDPVGQAAVPDVGLLAVVGERLHVGFATRRLLLLLGKRRLGHGAGWMLLLVGHAAPGTRLRGRLTPELPWRNGAHRPIATPLLDR